MTDGPHRAGIRATPPKYGDKSAVRIAVIIFIASVFVVMVVSWFDLLPAPRLQQVIPAGIWTDTDTSGRSSPRP
jgi:4-hydroxybenzoate polyprenyltransferase